MTARTRTRTRWRSLEAQEARLAWLLLAPTLLIVFGLVIFPAIFSVWMSFHHVGLDNLNDVFHAPWVGLQNYIRVVNDFAFKYQGPTNWGAAITSVVYSVTATVLTVVVGLIAALVLNRSFRGRGLARAVFLIPYVAPIVSVAYVWRWILDPRPSGVMNYVLMKLGLIQMPKAYLATPGLALALVILFEAWRYFPFAMLMILARLQAIDRSLYEAAAIDGANGWQIFRHVILPLLSPTTYFLSLIAVIGTFKAFNHIYVMREAGAQGTVNTFSVVIFDEFFTKTRYGYASALAFVLFAVILTLTYLNNRIQGSRVFYQ